MKIIKKNKKHLWTECHNCGSILQPSKKDIEEYSSKARYPDDHPMIVNNIMYVFTIEEKTEWITCPVCNCSIKFKETKKESYEPYC